MKRIPRSTGVRAGCIVRPVKVAEIAESEIYHPIPYVQLPIIAE
jgi:hypothetical protein